MDQLKFNRLPDEAFIRKNTLIGMSIVPFSSSTLWRKVRAGEFPKPIRLSEQITAWRVRDIRSWLKDPGQFRDVSQASEGKRL
jgi:prophage regulatory protein